MHSSLIKYILFHIARNTKRWMGVKIILWVKYDFLEENDKKWLIKRFGND